MCDLFGLIGPILINNLIKYQQLALHFPDETPTCLFRALLALIIKSKDQDQNRLY